MNGHVSWRARNYVNMRSCESVCECVCISDHFDATTYFTLIYTSQTNNPTNKKWNINGWILMKPNVTNDMNKITVYHFWNEWLNRKRNESQLVLWNCVFDYSCVNSRPCVWVWQFWMEQWQFKKEKPHAYSTKKKKKVKKKSTVLIKTPINNNLMWEFMNVEFNIIISCSIHIFFHSIIFNKYCLHGIWWAVFVSIGLFLGQIQTKEMYRLQ